MGIYNRFVIAGVHCMLCEHESVVFGTVEN